MSRLSQKAAKKAAPYETGVKTVQKSVHFAKGEQISVIQEEPSMVADTTNNDIQTDQVLIPEPSRKDIYQRIDQEELEKLGVVEHKSALSETHLEDLHNYSML